MLLFPPVLKRQRAEELERRMAPLLTVEDVDVVEERRARGPEGLVDELDLERAEVSATALAPAVAPSTQAVIGSILR